MDTTVIKTTGEEYTIPQGGVNVGTKDAPVIQNQGNPQLIVTSDKAKAEHAENSSLLDRTLRTIAGAANSTSAIDQAPAKDIDKAKKDVDLVEDSNYSDPMTKILDGMLGTSNLATQSLIAGIKADKQQQTVKSNEAFDRYKRGMQTLGIQTNQAQATPELFMGGLLDAENKHLEKLQTLDADERKAILDAEMARDDRNAGLFRERMNYVRDIRKEKANTLKELQDSQRQNLSDSITMAETVAPFVYDALEQAETDDEKEQILLAISKKYGNMPLDVLVSQVSKIKAEKEGEQREVEQEEYERSQDALDNERADRQIAISEQNANKKGGTADMSAGEKKSVGLSLLNKAFSGGFRDETGTPYVDQNNNIIPSQFKTLLKEAMASYGISRKEFIDAYGDQIYLPAAKDYGLRPAEIKLLSGSSEVSEPGSEGEDDGFQ